MAPPPDWEGFMTQATCVQNVTFGATGEVYRAGEVYDVPLATLARYPDYFKKKVGRPKKLAETEENK